MIELVSKDYDPQTKEATIAVKSNGACRIQWSLDGPIEPMNVDTPPTDSTLGVCSASKVLTESVAAKITVLGNDCRLSLPPLTTGLPPAGRSDITWERQAEIWDSARAQTVVKSRLG